MTEIAENAGQRDRSPAGIRTRTSRPVRASVLPLDEGAVLKPIAGPLRSFSRGSAAALPFSSPFDARPALRTAQTLLVMIWTPNP